MKQTSELLDTGILQEVSVLEVIKDCGLEMKPISVRDFMKAKGLDDAMENFGILLNGKNIDLDTIIEPQDKLIILPHLKGG